MTNAAVSDEKNTENGNDVTENGKETTEQVLEEADRPEGGRKWLFKYWQHQHQLANTTRRS